MLRKLTLPEMHLILPKDIPSEQVENGTFENTGKYLFCGPFIKFDERLPEGYEGVNLLDAACRKHDLDYIKNIKIPGPEILQMIF